MTLGNATTFGSAGTTVLLPLLRSLGHLLFAHVTLQRSERSEIAALVTEMLEV